MLRNLATNLTRNNPRMRELAFWLLRIALAGAAWFIVAAAYVVAVGAPQ